MTSLRKNGMPSSCEPCRKSKLRCDHKLPTCERCNRTKKPEKCVYRPSHPVSTLKHSKYGIQDGAEQNGHAEDEGDLFAARPDQRDRPVSKRRRLSQSEYLGMTSHFTLFKESSEHLGSPSYEVQTQNNDHLLPPPNSIPIELGETKQGAHLLQLLRDLPIYRRIAQSYLTATQDCEFMGRQLVELTFDSLQELADIPTRGANSLLSHSREVFKLFSKPIRIHSLLTFSEYMSAMSYRWEIVGLAFSFVGFGTVLPCDWESLFHAEGKPISSRREMGLLALSATETCLRFCHEAGALNDAVSWLVHQHTFLTTLIHGDRDYRSWRALGDLSTIVFTLGLNQPSPDDSIPFWLAETRKRVMSGSFSADKQLATFLGRPPRISWRFCNIPLPLDISFTDVIAEPSVRDAAIRRLDADGWNTVENDSQAVWLRCVLLMGPVRESILELSLSQNVENLPQRIEELLQESRLVWEGLPSFIHRRHDPRLSSRVPNVKESINLQLHLDHIYDQFLLHRIYSKRLNLWSPDLVKVSHDIMNQIILLVENRIRIMRLSPELSWVICFYGLPTAGVLSIELVHRCSALHMTSSSLSPDVPATTFPKSQVIQNLTIFASYLQIIIQSHEGNYDICQQARQTILRVLDVVLSPQPAQSAFHSMDSTAELVLANETHVADILDYNHFITNLDNWQFDLQNGLNML